MIKIPCSISYSFSDVLKSIQNIVLLIKKRITEFFL